MHVADLQHDDARLQAKLERIYALRRTRVKVNWDQDNYRDLLAFFENPHTKLPPVIHVAGTNGKGSTIAILRSIIEAQGLKAHVYTSPHLIRVNERIVLAGAEIDNAYLEDLIDQALDYIGDRPLSFFEVITAVAFKAFSETPADVLLLEVGMGGRLDCTNIIPSPLVSIINRISMDHTEFLGNSLSDIAAEKAGIIKRGAPCVVGYQGDNQAAQDIYAAIYAAAKKQGVEPQFYGDSWHVLHNESHMKLVCDGEENEYPLPSLHGAHQIYNAGLALMALRAIKAHLPVSDEAIDEGLRSAAWRGRMQNLKAQMFGASEGAELWLDSGHNDSAAEAIAAQAAQWQDQDHKTLHVVCAMLGTKDARLFLTPILPHANALHIVPIASDPSAQKAQDIKAALGGADVEAHESVIAAVETIFARDKNARVMVCGSVYLAGEVLAYIEGLGREE